MFQARYQRIVDHIVVLLLFCSCAPASAGSTYVYLKNTLIDDLAPPLLGFSVLLDRTVAHGMEEVKLNRFALAPCIRASPRRALAMIGEESATIQAQHQF
jgi:hypothetical protein